MLIISFCLIFQLPFYIILFPLSQLIHLHIPNLEMWLNFLVAFIKPFTFGSFSRINLSLFLAVADVKSRFSNHWIIPENCRPFLIPHTWYYSSFTFGYHLYPTNVALWTYTWPCYDIFFALTWANGLCSSSIDLQALVPFVVLLLVPFSKLVFLIRTLFSVFFQLADSSHSGLTDC